MFLQSRNLLSQQSFASQAPLFRYMWDNLPHISEISGEPLQEFNACNFMHVLPKGSYGMLKLNVYNIVLATFEEHDLYDKQTHKAKEDERFKWVFDWAQDLRGVYNKYYQSHMY